MILKNIKELGLETIQLEDQVLLVDNINVSESLYVLCKNKIYSNKIHSFNGIRYDECKRVITSTKPLEGLPVLVIEDEAMLNVLNLIEESKIETESTKIILMGSYITGYNKAKEIYKFTEEDLRKAIDISQSSSYVSTQHFSGHSSVKYNFKVDEIIESLTKKELWIEFENYFTDECERNEGNRDGESIKKSLIPKITNNQIKAVWK